MLEQLRETWLFKQSLWPSQARRVTYSEEYQWNDESQKRLLQEELDDLRQDAKPKPSLSSRISWICWILLKAVFIVSYIFFVCVAWRSRNQSTCILGSESIYDDAPVLYETKTFQRAGFHDGRHAVMTSFEGEPNLENDAAWEHLLDVGVVAISEEENSRLTHSSASTRHNPKEHIVQLEMFHQIHCLKWLRDQFWALQRAHTMTEALVEFPQRVNHTDHCIDYLRQVIMCHGDMTPITFEWNDEIDGYLAHHSVEHSCRNFDSIYEWAEKRDTTGLSPGGKHQNVELQQPEEFD